MPKKASSAVIWSTQYKRYEFHEHEKKKQIVSPSYEDWLAWLDRHSSFSFQGRTGHLSLLKESRSRGEGYWYAYRRHKGKIMKKYLGRTRDLSLERLEETTLTLNTDDNLTIDQKPSATQQPLLTPKLHLPRQRTFFIPRERLFAQLDAGRERKLTVVSAPAGAGKTTLVSAWAAHQNKTEVAWLSLDEGDNDPVRFWRYIIAACQMIYPGIKQSSWALLDGWRTFSFDYEQAMVVVTSLLNELSTLSGRGILILEDYHEISTPLIHQALTTFLTHLPPTLHLVLLTRHDPPLPLAQWRAYDDLYEINAADLRFSVEETRAFLKQSLAQPLPDDTIQRLTARTEGWAVGLQLVTLALQGQNNTQDIETVLANFTGDHRYVLDYLVAEVLHTLPEELQMFLLQTSFLRRLTASLCNAVIRRSDSDLLLDQLERAHLFLVPFNGSQVWYRYHALFAEAMYAEARRRLGNSRLRELALKASHWYDTHALLTEAIESAFVAQDFAYAARLVERFAEQIFYFDGIEEFTTLHRWLKALPEELLHIHPHLCFSLAFTLLFSQDRYASETWAQIHPVLQIAEQHWQEQGNQARLGEILAFRSLATGWQGNFLQALSLARQALTMLPPEETRWRGVALVHLGKGAQLAGNFIQARQFLIEGCACSEMSRNIYPLLTATTSLGAICFAQGDLHQSAHYYQRVSELAGGRWHTLYEQGKKALDDRGLVLVGLARLAYEWNDLTLAEQQATEGLSIGTSLRNEYLSISATLVLARIWQARDAQEQAQQALQKYIITDRETEQSYNARLELTWLALVDGNPELAQRLLDSCHQYASRVSRLQQEQLALLDARFHIARGQYQEALLLLARWHDEAHRMERRRSEIQILILMALTYLEDNDLSQARRFLLQASVLARPSGHRRIFLDEGEKMLTLIRLTLADRGKESSYLRELVLSAVQPAATNVLSPQELRVLRLLVNGHSRPEIAKELVVSINTIKTQIHSIYRKLHVTSRKEACATARRLHLI